MKMHFLVGTWPWQQPIPFFPERAPRPVSPAPKPPPKQRRLVDWLAEGSGLSRGKVRRAVVHGRVKVDGVVELNADRMVNESAKVELCTES